MQVLLQCQADGSFKLVAMVVDANGVVTIRNAEFLEVNGRSPVPGMVYPACKMDSGDFWYRA